MVINGNEADKKPIEFGSQYMKHTECITLLGSHLSQTGNLMDDLNSDFCSRFRSCIKFDNFLHSNRRAPLSVKLEVLKACVVSSVMHNSEAFGHKISKDLETQYYKLIKSTLGVRQSTPNLTVFGSPNLKSAHHITTTGILQTFWRKCSTWIFTESSIRNTKTGQEFGLHSTLCHYIR